MKAFLFFLVLIISLQESFAGRRGNDGGGGHPCKSLARTYFDNVVRTLEDNPDLLSRFPEWTTLKNVMNPLKNPDFVISITDKPIEQCPLTKSALACSFPLNNVMILHCGDTGWNSFDTEMMYRHLIHEIYWWSDLNDSHYFFSAALAKEIVKLVKPKNSFSLSQLEDFPELDFKEISFNSKLILTRAIFVRAEQSKVILGVENSLNQLMESLSEIYTRPKPYFGTTKPYAECYLNMEPKSDDWTLTLPPEGFRVFTISGKTSVMIQQSLTLIDESQNRIELQCRAPGYDPLEATPAFTRILRDAGVKIIPGLATSY